MEPLLPQNRTKIVQGFMRTKFGVVYKVRCKKNNKVYIGQTTKSITERFNQHCTAKSVIGGAIRKHGKENFEIEEVISCFDLESLLFFERKLIDELRAHVSFGGYNVSFGQEGTFSTTRKRKIKEKQFDALIETEKWLEVRGKLSAIEQVHGWIKILKYVELEYSKVA